MTKDGGLLAGWKVFQSIIEERVMTIYRVTDTERKEKGEFGIPVLLIVARRNYLFHVSEN